MTYAIYQAPIMTDNVYGFIFRNYETACKVVSDFPHNWESFYEKRYEAEYKGCEIEVKDILEDLFDIFNVSIPRDYKGRSMSVSDIIVLNGIPYYCDSFGFKEIK